MFSITNGFFILAIVLYLYKLNSECDSHQKSNEQYFVEIECRIVAMSMVIIVQITIS